MTMWRHNPLGLCQCDCGSPFNGPPTYATVTERTFVTDTYSTDKRLRISDPNDRSDYKNIGLSPADDTEASIGGKQLSSRATTQTEK